MPRKSTFEPVIKKARFNAPGYSPQSMAVLGNAALQSIQSRLLRSQDVYDAIMPPLTPRYAKYKSNPKRFGWIGSAVRDLKASGRTFRSMRVLRAGQNYVVIGFIDPQVVTERVRPNNRLVRQWGMSPRNFDDALTFLRETPERPVVVVQEK